MKLKKIYQNPEIVDNIHFRPYDAVQLAIRDRYYDAKSFMRNQDYESELEDKKAGVFERILETFRYESGDLGATDVNWLRIDRYRLPEKYKNPPITTESFYKQGYCEDQDFIDNLHFEKYSKLYVYKLRSKRKYKNLLK